MSKKISREASPQRKPTSIFQVTNYDGPGTEPETRTMTRAEVVALDLESYSSCRAKCLGKHGFLCPPSGRWVNYGDNGKGIGEVCEKILEALQWNPGVYHDPKALYELTGEENLLDGVNVAARVCALRKAHHETKASEHFILTSEGGVAWNIALKWISVERVLSRRAEADPGRPSSP